MHQMILGGFDVTPAAENLLILSLICVWCRQQNVMWGLFLGRVVKEPFVNWGVTILLYPVLSGCKSGLFLLWPANCNSFKFCLGKFSQPETSLAFWFESGWWSGTAALGTELFQSTERLSSVNVKFFLNFFFFANHWLVSLKPPGNNFQRDYTDELAFLQSGIASE